MSRAKSIWFVAGGGSFDSSTTAAKMEEQITKPARRLALSVESRVIGNLEPLFEGANSGKSNVSFPLTPALSPKERENRSPVLRQSSAPLCSESRNACLPLPKGEGRGEGEANVSRRKVPVLLCRKLPDHFMRVSELRIYSTIVMFGIAMNFSLPSLSLYASVRLSSVIRQWSGFTI